MQIGFLKKQYSLKKSSAVILRGALWDNFSSSRRTKKTAKESLIAVYIHSGRLI